ncbi:hypothetical protein E4U21_006797 [Claviceps maximensis]|nr:hypothetical protein E4U21_006797 [Claviceps maximensis]
MTNDRVMEKRINVSTACSYIPVQAAMTARTRAHTHQAYGLHGSSSSLDPAQW